MKRKSTNPYLRTICLMIVMICAFSVISKSQVTNTNTSLVYTTIQAAIDDAATLDGHTITVAAGTYAENVVVNKELEIKGQGVANTIVVPATVGANTGGGSLTGTNVFLVQANNVTINELTVDGDNISLTGGVDIGGANIDARCGIITNHGLGVFTNLVVHNVAVKNIYLRGIYASSGGSFNFYANTVQNVQADPSSIAMFNFGGSGAFTNNTISNANDAIASNHSTGTTYSGNTISNSGSGIHSDNNGSSGGVADVISDNTVSNSSANGYGIFVFAPYKDIVIERNTITNVEVGLTSAGSYTNATPVFRNNIVDGLNKTNSIGVYSTTEIWGYTSGNQKAIFTNNYIKNNVKGFLMASEAGFTNSSVINNNSITGNTTGVKLVKDYTEVPATGTFALNMTCNWWSTTDATVIASQISGGVVPFIPFLTSGTDNDLVTPGFQPAPGTCTGAPVNVFTDNTETVLVGSYATIQAAINDATTLNGHVVRVAEGTYTEDIIVNKQLDIRGPNYNISPNGGTRVSEAIIQPATSSPFGEIIKVQASNVNINGFTIDGDNPSLTPSLLLGTGGATLDAAEAVTVYVDNVNNLSVKNNIVKNLTFFGVTIYGASFNAPATTGHIVSDNLFQDMGTYTDPEPNQNNNMNFWGGGVLLYNEQYAAVTNNVMTNVRIGVQTGNFHLANPGAVTYQVISGNTIEARRRGIFENMGYGTASPYTVSNNTITGKANANETAFWDGILVASKQTTASIISGNAINGSDVTAIPTIGISIWNNQVAPLISGGSITGVQVGINVNNFEGYPSTGSDAGNTSATIDGVTINGATVAGIKVQDHPSNSNNATVFAEIKNTTISGAATAKGIFVSGADAGANIHDNALTITGTAVGIDVNGVVVSPTNPLTITNNTITITSQLAGPTPTVGINLYKVTGTQAATISNNNISGPYYGYLVYNLNTTPKTSIDGGTITGIMQGVSAINIDPLGSGTRLPSTLGVSNLNMSGFTGAHAGGFHAGVYVYTGGAVDNTSITATVDKVSVTGTGKIQQDCAGLSFADFSTLATAGQNITVTECTLTGNLNRGINIRGTNAIVDIGTSTLTGNGSDPFGTGGNDGFGIIVRQGATATVHNNFITNPATVIGGYQVTALYTDPGTAPGATMTATTNSLSQGGNATSKLAVNAGGTLNATCNWWGSNLSATVATKINGVVTYNPLLTNGTDESIDAGFQNSSCRTVSTANPTMDYVTLTDLSDVLIDANLVPLNSINKVKFRIKNFDQTPENIIPAGTTTIRINLGAKLKVDPLGQLATAPLNTYFNWTVNTTEIPGNDIIYGNQILDIPADFDEIGYFNVKAVTAGSAVATADFQVTNQSATNFLVDWAPDNNHAEINTYTVLNEFLIVKDAQVNVSCFGGNNGSITVHATGGAIPYQYSIDGTNWLPATPTNGAHTFNGLIAESYTIQARDLLGQLVTLSPVVVITEPTAALSATETHVNVLCRGNTTGSIDLTVTGGTSPYTYLWNNAAITEDISGLVAGTYSVTVTDANGCTTTLSIEITQPAEVLAATETHVNVLCFGNTTGSIDLSVTGGTSPYTYLWNNNATTQDLSGLSAGTYSVTVTDASGCTTNKLVEITQPTSAIYIVVGPSTVVTHVTCNGSNNGTIDLSFTAQGGTGTLNYVYAWSKSGGGFTAATQDIGSLAPGTYSVIITVTDANGCSAQFNHSPIQITEPPVLNATVTAITPALTCAGTSAGSVTVTATGGTPGISPLPLYEYLIDGGAFQSTGSFTGLTAGTHTVTARDANGCLKSVSFTITEPANTDVTLGGAFNSNLFNINGAERTIVYNLFEVAGKAATPVTLRISQPIGYTISFDNNLSSFTISGTTYSLDNSKWVLTYNSSGGYYDLTRTGAGGNNTLTCSEGVNVSIKMTRQTNTKSAFNLNAQVRRANGEILLINNTNSMLFIGQ